MYQSNFRRYQGELVRIDLQLKIVNNQLQWININSLIVLSISVSKLGKVFDILYVLVRSAVRLHPFIY